MATTSRRTSLKMENNYCHTLLHKKVLIAFQLHDDGHTVVTLLIKPSAMKKWPHKRNELVVFYYL